MNETKKDIATRIKSSSLYSEFFDSDDEVLEFHLSAADANYINLLISVLKERNE